MDDDLVIRVHADEVAVEEQMDVGPKEQPVGEAIRARSVVRANVCCLKDLGNRAS